MITIPKNLIKQIIEGEKSQQELELFILNNFNMMDIIKAFAEILLTSDTVKPQITVTPEEYNSIVSLFKVKGQRVLEDGTITEEKRGRKKKGEQNNERNHQ